MEWQIMNTDGMNGLSLGTWTDGQYSISYDCFESLTAIYDKLVEDDPMQRTVRRQLATSHVIQKDLIPILTSVEDDIDLFMLCVKLLVNLTQPVECLQHSVQPNNASPSALPWYWDVEKMLCDAKTACSNVKCPESICREIERILNDAGEYDLVDSDCEAINQCLLLIRNLLHIQDNSGQGRLSGIHMLFLKYLFRCGIDRILIRLLNASQNEYWGVTVVQLISLLYKDLVSEIFQHLDVTSSCGEESCDSSSCSQCEAAMDRPFKTEIDRSPKSSDSSRGSSPCGFTKDKDSVKPACAGDTETVVNMENYSTDQLSSRSNSRSNSRLTSHFRECCKISHTNENKYNCELCVQSQSLKSSRSDESLRSKSDSMGSNCSSCTFSVEELGLHLTDFTTSFLQSGFSSLICILKKVLMKHGSSTAALDDSYFLWTVAFFLKFARKKEIEFKNLREVFTVDVIGFLVYEAVSNGEEVLNLHKHNLPCNLNMRRLHLSVSAIREILKTLAFHREKGIPDGEMEYLENLQRQLSNMNDLRQLFLWLIRVYVPSCQSTLFLRDVIVTNHYFLLLLEEWIGKEFCTDKNVDMLSHVKQFSAGSVMNNYGHLLQNFLKNDHHVNNCIFTMMHHVAGDCLKPESLLQVSILKTFLQIWDTEMPVTQEMNDLMEYVIQKFLSMAEDNPLSCALQLFSSSQEEESMNCEETGEEGDSVWTQEEEDKLILWFVELESDNNVVSKLVDLFSENGMKKSKLEIINQLYKMGWLPSEKLDAIMKYDKELATLQKTPNSQTKDVESENLAILGSLSQLKEEEVVPSCVSKLLEEGYREQIMILQNRLLEMAYIKLDDDPTKKIHVEEPVLKFYTSKCKDVPLLLYSEEEDKFGHNIYTMALLDQIGFKLEDDSSSWRYPRIPKDWTVPELIQKAEMLGSIDIDHLKFDLDVGRSVQPPMVTQSSAFNHMENGKRSEARFTVPGPIWMKAVSHYNTEQLSGKDTNKQQLHRDMDVE